MIDFEKSSPLPINEGDTVEVLTDIHAGSTVCFEKIGDGVFGMRALSDEEIAGCPFEKYVVNKGNSPGTISLTLET